MSNTKLTTPQAGTPSSSSSSSSSSPSAAAVAAAAGAGTKSGKSNVEIIIEGYLYKKSPKNILGKHPWQKRYFILALITTEKGSHKSLIYYQSHEAVKSQAQALGAIPMDNIKAIVVSDNKNGRFNIKIAGREYALRCDTVAELQRWVNGLSLFMEKSTKYEKPKELPDSPSDTMRLMATTPNAHALFSADDTIAMMQRGSAFIKYNRVSKTSNEVDRQVVLVFYKKDQTPLGSLYWCEPGVAHSLPSRGLPLHTLTDVYLGKQTAAFKSPLAAGSHSEKCFSVVGADGNEYNLEGDTRELIAAWLFGINSLMTRTGGKKVITVESTRSGKTRTVGPKPTKSSSSHHSKSSTPATATAAPAGTAATTTTTTPTAAEPAPAKVATPEATPVSATASASASASASSPLEASQTDAQAQQEAAAQKARDEATLRAQQVAEEQMRAAAGPMAALRALQQKRASEGTEQSKDTAEQAAHHHHHATEQATQALASTTISDKEEPAAAETAEGYASPTDHSLAAHHVNHAESLSRDAVHQQAAAEAEAHAQAQAEAEAEARRRALSEQHRYEEQLYESAQRAQRERERIELERQREYEDMLREEQAAEDAAAATAAAAAAAAAASASSPSNQYQQDDTPPSHSPIASPSHAAGIVATPYSDPEQATVIPVARPLTQAEIEALSPIGQWLYHVGPIYLEYQSAFESSGIDHEFLVTLTDDDLQDLGVSKGLHRKKLLVAIEKEKQIQEAEKKRREEEEQAAQAAQRAQGKAVTPSATTATASRTTASSVSGMNPHDLIKQNIRLAKERNAQKKLQFAEPTATSPEEDGTMTIAAMAAKLAAARLAREGSGAVTPRETPRDTVPSSQHIYPTPTSSSSSSSTSTSSKPLPANVVLLDQIRPMDASQLTWMNLPKFPSKATTQQETDTKAAQDEFFQTRAEAAERRKSQAHGVLPPASSSSSSSSSSNDTAHTQSIEQTLRRTTVIDASGALTDSAAVATVPVVTASIDDDDDAGVVDDSTNDAGIDDGVDTIDPALAQAIGSVAQGSEHTTAHGVALAPHHISHRVSIHAAPPSSLPSSGYATPREQ